MHLSNKQVQHFHLRTGFGENLVVIQNHSGQTQKTLVEELFRNSEAILPINHLKNPVANNAATDLKVLKMMLKSKKQVAEVSLKWTIKMAQSPAQLREKMTFFWHNHFATKVPFAYLMQVQNNTFREHALGNFGEMLHAIAKDPAMLLFLNNQQNKKRRPNENFAREVMELFTLGDGNYAESDIKEAARAFTGWQVNRQGKFELNQRHHDFGSKTIFGNTGDFSGEDVLNLILDKKECAVFICRKLYRYLIHHNEDETFIKEMADEFYDSNYDISNLIRFILNSDEFIKEAVIGTRIASPTELLVRYIRTFNLKFKTDRVILAGQKSLGQVPLFPPNVSGWREQREWIDSSSLLYRMRLPLLMFGDQIKTGKRGQRWKPEVDWNPLVLSLKDVSDQDLTQAIINRLIQSDKSKIDQQNLDRFGNSESRTDRIIAIATRVMASPEFQLI
ncbi:MAG: hypothetical protein ACI85F_002060 [Bacteroidia bacterium]|jgi:uncharacterized protein (DUF1800 family)